MKAAAVSDPPGVCRAMPKLPHPSGSGWALQKGAPAPRAATMHQAECVGLGSKQIALIKNKTWMFLSSWRSLAGTKEQEGQKYHKIAAEVKNKIQVTMTDFIWFYNDCHHHSTHWNGTWRTREAGRLSATSTESHCKTVFHKQLLETVYPRVL